MRIVATTVLVSIAIYVGKVISCLGYLTTRRLTPEKRTFLSVRLTFSKQSDVALQIINLLSRLRISTKRLRWVDSVICQNFEIINNYSDK